MDAEAYMQVNTVISERRVTAQQLPLVHMPTSIARFSIGNKNMCSASWDQLIS
jgi:hypothetical protein